LRASSYLISSFCTIHLSNIVYQIIKHVSNLWCYKLQSMGSYVFFWQTTGRIAQLLTGIHTWFQFGVHGLVHTIQPPQLCEVAYCQLDALWEPKNCSSSFWKLQVCKMCQKYTSGYLKFTWIKTYKVKCTSSQCTCGLFQFGHCI
jgi:hypothetical protein